MLNLLSAAASSHTATAWRFKSNQNVSSLGLFGHTSTQGKCSELLAFSRSIVDLLKKLSKPREIYVFNL